MDLAFVDLETTGGVAQRDRITEIAVIRVREGLEVSRWSSLINPQQKLSPFIQRLTGLTDAQLAQAPLFADIASEIEHQLNDAVFVAHNARFDYGFLKNEFRRIQRPWQARNLCTVKLSRSLYPEFRKHGLDQLIQRHHLTCESRHRAMGDAAATVAFYQHAMAEFGEQTVNDAVHRLILRPTMPPNLPPDALDGLPTSPGVYRFWGEDGALLYVGKSVNIYQRVSSHFQDDHRLHKSQQLSQQVYRIDYTQTAGDLGAQLLELQEIKQRQPIHNRRSRAAKELKTIRLQDNGHGYLIASIEEDIDMAQLPQHFGLFKTRKEAEKALAGLTRTYQLCNALMGLETATGPCFGRQIEQCKGACEQQEDCASYNARVNLALQGLKLKSWPWDGPIGIREKDDFTGIEQFHVVWQWCHLVTVSDEQSFYDWQTQQQPALTFERDSYQLLQRYLFSGKTKPDVVLLPAWPDASGD
ncbi:GIY-YIG nuclease family protein [Neiella marina]|uniref:DNA-directed DNA polymerase n=1 Tax=Neiella holothuriorum TaxID=2870530 RepID=A0ABS7EGE2_9GAMM|nr:exonuclease domain-containing protein [Neiella holothuriorum]MBW8191003.1 GIY-YIG nuclease family protein [Neiella holothuriorum]